MNKFKKFVATLLLAAVVFTSLPLCSFTLTANAATTSLTEYMSIEYNGHIYALYTNALAWSQADATAKEIGGYLATISSKEENDKIYEMVAYYGDNCLIGYNDIQTEGIWVASDGSSSISYNSSSAKWLDSQGNEVYTNWTAGEPNNSSGAQNCASMYYNTGMWDDISNDVTRAFVVEFDTYKAYFDYQGGKTCKKTVVYNSRKYCAYATGYSWSVAKAYCDYIGGHLVTITSQGENDAVSALIGDQGFKTCWLGGYEQPEGTWKWVTDEEFLYTFWDTTYQEPTNQAGEWVLQMAAASLGTTKVLGEWLDNSDLGSNVSTDIYNKQYCGFVCEFETVDYEQEKTSLTETASLERNGHIYALYSNAVSWIDAKNYATALGGHLATITSKEEQDAVDTFYATYAKTAWLGMSDYKKEGTYTLENDEGYIYYDETTSSWLNQDGESAYTNWASSSFTGNTELDFVSATTSWSNVGGVSTYLLNGFIVEYENYDSYFSTREAKKVLKSYIYNGNKYQAFSTGYSWSVAKAYCEYIGGHLVTIESAGENENVYTLISGLGNNVYWIGLYESPEGKWNWVTDEEVTYTKWDPQAPEPSNLAGEYCAQIVESNSISTNKQLGEWCDGQEFGSTSTTSAYYQSYCGFVCEFEDVSYDEITKDISKNEVSKDALNGHVYVAFNDMLNQYDAEQIAKNMGGYLATVTSAEESAIVNDLVKDANMGCWIGISDEETEGIYKYENNEGYFYYDSALKKWLNDKGEEAFVNWSAYNPDDYNNQDFVYVQYDGTWDDGSAYNQFWRKGFVVEFDSIQDYLDYNDSIVEDLEGSVINGHLYLMYYGESKYNFTKEICEYLGGHMLTISSEEEFSELSSDYYITKYTTPWLGLECDENSNWNWVIDESLDYTKWATNEPSSSSNQSVAYVSLDGWHSTNKNQKHEIVCEFDSVYEFMNVKPKELEFSDGVYHISTPEDLMNLSANVANGNSYSGQTVVLDNDIDMSGVRFLPIGNENTPFSGVFDGQQHNISNLTYKMICADVISLFSHIENAEIKSINLESIDYDLKNSTVGGLVGVAESSIISNCSVSGEILGFLASGIVYEAIDTDIYNCANYANVIGLQESQGVARVLENCSVKKCYNYGNIEACLAYGIATFVNDSNINECYSAGTLKCEYTAFALFYGLTSSTATNCMSVVNVEQLIENQTPYPGDLGFIYHTDDSIIENCYNGSKSELKQEGGIVNDANAYEGNVIIKDCYYDETVSDKVVGEVNEENPNTVSITNCGSLPVGEIDLTSKEWVEKNLGWDFENDWYYEYGTDYKYPKLRSQTNPDDFYFNGTFGDFEWSFDNYSHVLKINGTGKMPDFEAEKTPWLLHLNSIKEVEFSEGITYIGENTLSGCTGVDKIKFPSSLTNLGRYAIDDTKWFANKTTPLVVVNDIVYAYKGTSQKVSVQINSGATAIADSFTDYDNISSLTLPSSVKLINEKALKDFSILTSISVSSGNTNYSSKAGVLYNKDKTSLLVYPQMKTSSSFTLMNSVTTIEEDAFKNNKYLEDVSMSNVVNIKNNAFEGCSKLNSLSVLDSLENIGDNAFEGCRSLKQIELPETLISIGKQSFKDCSSIEYIKLPDNLNRFDKTTFENCTALNEIHIGDNIESIDDGSFETTSLSKIYGYYKSAAYEFALINGIEFISSQCSIYLEPVEGELAEREFNAYVNYKIGQLPVPIRVGYYFEGWFTAVEGGNLIDADYIVDQDMTLYAQWSKAEIVNVSIETMPAKSKWFVGDMFDTTGMSLKIEFNTGDVKTVTQGFEVDVKQLKTVGNNTVTVSYRGFTTSFVIDVAEVVPVGLSVVQMPVNTNYSVNSTIDVTGLRLQVLYNNATSNEISYGKGVTLHYDFETVGKKTVQVEYEEKGTVVSTSFEVNVLTSPVITADAITASAGDIIEIPVYIESNDGLLGFAVEVEYDKNAMVPIDVVSNGLEGNFDSSIETSKNNIFKIVWSGLEEYTGNGLIFTMKFKVKTDAFGDYSVNLSSLKTDTFDDDYNEIVIACNDSLVTVSNEDRTTTTYIYSNDVKVSEKDFVLPVYASKLDAVDLLTTTVEFDSSIFNVNDVCSEVADLEFVIKDNLLSVSLKNLDTITTEKELFEISLTVKEFVEDNYTFKIDNSNFDTRNAVVTLFDKTSENTIAAEEIDIRPGSTFKLPVRISNNTGIMGYKLFIKYNSDVLVANSIECGENFGGMIDDNVGINPGNFSVVWYANENVVVNDALFYINFTVKEAAQIGKSEITIDYSLSDTFDSNWNAVSLNCKESYVNVIMFDGWVGDKYYKDGAMFTGVKAVDGVYYDFGKDGNSKGKFTGDFIGEDGKHYYAKLGALVGGWFIINDEWYFFDETTFEGVSGEMKFFDKVTYTFEDGRLTSGVWCEDDIGYQYYYGPDRYKDCFATIDGERYYFSDIYRYDEGFHCIKDNTNNKISCYQFGNRGVLISEYQGSGLINTTEGKFYLKDGIVQTGLHNIDGNYYYFNTNYGYAYTYCKFKVTITNGYDFTPGTYEFDENGVIVTKNGYFVENGTTYYYVNNVKAKNVLVQVGDDYYYFGYDGQPIKDRKYYAANSRCDLPAKEYYYFDSEGKALKGIVKGKLYINGQLAPTGIHKVGDNYYYSESGKVVVDCRYYAAKTFCELAAKEYYNFGTDGKALQGVVDGKLYINGQIAPRGLVKVGDDYYYSESGKVIVDRRYYAEITKCDLPAKDYYYFGADGKMLQGVVEKYLYINGQRAPRGLTKFGEDYYYSESGKVIVDRRYYATISNCDLPAKDYYFFGSDGKALQGVVDGKLYINGQIAPTGLAKIGDDYYYSESGKVIVDRKYYAAASNCDLPAKDYYYFGEDGKMLQGLVNGYYYVNGQYLATGLNKVGNDYYYSESGKVIAGRKYYVSVSNCDLPAKAYYYFGEDGKLLQGLVNGYYYVNGQYLANGLTKIGEDYYYIESGKAVTGKYYASKTNCDLPAKAYYYFGKDGKMLQGVVNGYYYENGKYGATGLTKVGEDYYYVEEGKVVTSCKYYVEKSNCDLPAGQYYYFDVDGTFCEGIYSEDDGIYYYEAGKRVFAGLIKVDGNFYYAGKDGKCATDIKMICRKSSCVLPVNREYTFGADGKLVK